MEHDGVIREEMGHKTPSPNVIVGGGKERREIEEIEGRRKKVLLKF